MLSGSHKKTLPGGTESNGKNGFVNLEQGKDTNIELLSQADPAMFGAVKELKEIHSYDVIWQQNDIGAGIILYGPFELKVGINKKTKEPYCHIVGVSKLNILEFVRLAGFRKRYLSDSNIYVMVHTHKHIMEEVTIDLIRVETFNEVQRNDSITVYFEDLQFTFHKDLLLTIYLKNQDQIFNKNFLELMDEFDIPELTDTREISYFLFTNCIMKVGKDFTESVPYEKLETLNLCVWRSHITNRAYKPNKTSYESEFAKVVANVANHDEKRINAFRSAFGYLLHNYNGSHMGQVVIFYDEKPTNARNPQGGTGKGLLAQGLSFMREVAKIDGKHFKADDKFRFQTVKPTSEIVFIDDLNKDVPFEVFFSCSTDGWTIERKFADTITLPPKDSPKMLFSMNTVVGGNGSSHRRRMFILELSDHYSRQIKTGSEHPIEDEHGILFDRINWSETEWNAFTQYMIECLAFYLQYDLQPYDLINVGKNTLIQSTGDDFANWVESKNFQVGVYYPTKELFEEYKADAYGEDPTYKQRTFTNSIKRYADIKGWVFKSESNSTTKLSQFIFSNES